MQTLHVWSKVYQVSWNLKKEEKSVSTPITIPRESCLTTMKDLQILETLNRFFFWQAHTHKHTSTDIYKNIACWSFNNTEDIDTEVTVIGILYLRAINTNISRFIDVWGDSFHTFAYIPLFPFATCIQVTNAVWESSVRLFILHSKAYNKEHGFYLLNRNYHDCLLLLRCNKMWPDYLELSLLLQIKCHETTLIPARTVRYACHSVWNKGTVPVSIQVMLLI